MLSRLIKYFSVLISVLALSACDETYPLQFLLEHPEQLEAQLNSCFSEKPTLDPTSQACLQAKAAQKKFAEYLSSREREPGRFGQYILTSQTQCAQWLIQISNMKHLLADLEVKNAPREKIESTKEKLSKLQKDYEQLNDEVAFMLAVIGLQSP